MYSFGVVSGFAHFDVTFLFWFQSYAGSRLCILVVFLGRE